MGSVLPQKALGFGTIMEFTAKVLENNEFAELASARDGARARCRACASTTSVCGTCDDPMKRAACQRSRRRRLAPRAASGPPSDCQFAATCSCTPLAANTLNLVASALMQRHVGRLLTRDATPSVATCCEKRRASSRDGDER